VSILDRYIAREFWKGFAAALATCLVLYIGADTMRQGLREEIPAAYAFQYSLYQLPEVFVLLMPAACLMGTLICLSGFARRNELTAMFASGISLARISFVLICMVFILCCFSFIITDRVIPPVNKAKAQFYRTVIQKRPDIHADIKQSKIWYRSKNLIYNIRAFDQRKNRLQGLSIYMFDDNFELMQQVEASIANYDNGKWRLEDGLITIFDGTPPFPMTKKFHTQLISLPEGPEDFQEIEKEVETLRLKSLWRFIVRNKEAGIDTHSYEVTFWSKISISLVPLIMALLGIPFATQHQRHSSIARDVTICFLLVVFYWLFYSTALSMGKSGAIAPILAAWGPNILFFAAGVFMILRGKRV